MSELRILEQPCRDRGDYGIGFFGIEWFLCLETECGRRNGNQSGTD
jgi:hypothetical protein